MFWLIFLSSLGDWSLQNRWMAENKAKYWMVMLNHCIVWAGCVCIALEYLGLYLLWKAIFLVCGHYTIDIWKSRNYKNEKDLWMVNVDQILHLVQLLIVYYW